jgi:hypothetical protein
LPEEAEETHEKPRGRVLHPRAEIPTQDPSDMKQESIHSTVTFHQVITNIGHFMAQVSLSFAGNRLSNTDTRNTAVLIGLRDFRMKTRDK